MSEKILALLIHEEVEPLNSLKVALESQNICTQRVRTCRDVVPLLRNTSLPELIFTDTTLPDGTWADVVSLAADAVKPITVIVVSRIADMKLYIGAIEWGAFDFIVPPFAAEDLNHVVRCAVWNVHSRRNSLGQAA